MAEVKDFLSRHLFGVICAASALLGLALGIAVPLLYLDRSSLERPSYVQRAMLPQIINDFLPMVSQLQTESIEDGQNLLGGKDLADLEAEPGTEPASGSETANLDMRGGNPAQAERPALVLADGQRVLGVDFDLGAASDHANDLTITKPIRLNGQTLGIANLAIDQQSRLHVSSEDLSNLLPEDLFAQINTGRNYIGFDDLRAGGLDISYDPLADVIEIVT